MWTIKRNKPIEPAQLELPSEPIIKTADRVPAGTITPARCDTCGTMTFGMNVLACYGEGWRCGECLGKPAESDDESSDPEWTTYGYQNAHWGR